MNQTNLKKILKDNVSFGLLALGVYNIIIFGRYFKSGRDISVIPPKMELLLKDILIVVIVTAITMIIDIIIRRLRKNKHTDTAADQEDE